MGEDMDINTRQLMEQDGLQIIEGAFDFKYKTRIFIRHPDGRLNPYYDYLYQIPILPNGTEIDMAKTAMPEGAPGGGPTALVDAGAVTNVELQLQVDGLVAWVLLGYIIIAVIMLAIIICIYFILHPGPVPPPCGTEPLLTPVGESDCAVIITMPNCDSRLFDSCNDEWMEDDWHEPPEPGPDWMTYLIIGIVAVGAIILIPPILRAIKPSPPPPRWEQHPAYKDRP